MYETAHARISTTGFSVDTRISITCFSVDIISTLKENSDIESLYYQKGYCYYLNALQKENIYLRIVQLWKQLHFFKI